MIFNFYVFNRSGVCLFHRDWNRKRMVLADSPDEDKKLVFGLLFSLKYFAQRVSPVDCEGLRKFSTSAYTLHQFETPTGLRLVLNTDPTVEDMRTHLQYIYSDLFVPYVIRNPLYTLNTPVNVPTFGAMLDQYVSKLHCFSS